MPPLIAKVGHLSEGRLGDMPESGLPPSDCPFIRIYRQ